MTTLIRTSYVSVFESGTMNETRKTLAMVDQMQYW